MRSCLAQEHIHCAHFALSLSLGIFLCVLEEATGGMRRELTIYFNGLCWTRSDVREKRVATSFSESNLEKDTLKQNRSL